jgi:hypothetical protein
MHYHASAEGMANDLLWVWLYMLNDGLQALALDKNIGPVYFSEL